MNRYFPLFAALFLIQLTTLAQNKVDEYVNMGLESNLALQQKEYALKSSIAALKEAKGLFFPEISLQSRYTIARGGRTIDFPAGDMINPVYSTLNQMLSEERFPQLDNFSSPLMREKEQETKASLVQPIFNRNIYFNQKIKKEQVKLSEAEIAQYKRELIFKIKEAYFNVVKAQQVLKLVENTMELVNENYRVSLKLKENDLITNDVVLRAKTEISSIELSETEANKNFTLSKNYLNFLINQPLDNAIEIENPWHPLPTVAEEDAEQKALSNREELTMIETQSNALEHLAKVYESGYWPNLTAIIDYGFEGETHDFSSERDFFMGSLVLQWTIFKGKTNRHKRSQALIQKQQVQLLHKETQNKIKLEVREALLETERQTKNVTVSRNRKTQASEAYKITNKRYRVGEASLIELLDARTNMTEAAFSEIVSHFDLLISIAKLEKTTNS